MATKLPTGRCTVFAGQAFAGDPTESSKGKPAATHVRPFSKMLKERKGKVNKRLKAQLRASNAGDTEQTAVSMRSYLEPGHVRPDSAIAIGGYGSEKAVFSYNGDAITEITYNRDEYYDCETDTWIETDTWYTDDYCKEEYAFDAYGYQTLYIHSYYRNNVPEACYKDEYAYNPNGTPLSEKFYVWEDGEWTLYYEAAYQYGESGMLTGGSMSRYGETYPVTVSGTPENLEMSIVIDGIPAAKYVLHYDPATLRELGREEYYLSEDGVFGLSNVYEYTYDNAGRLTAEICLYPQDNYYWKTEYAYDAKGQKLSVTESEAECYDGPYSVYWKEEYEYAGDRLLRIVEYDCCDDGNSLYRTTALYYSDGPDIVPPATPALRIRASGGLIFLDIPGQTDNVVLQLFDISGREALNTRVISGQPTSVQSIPDGVYVYRVLSGDNSYNGKLVI
jgi:hypothetical protein